jgi:HlyD family secretion protein
MKKRITIISVIAALIIIFLIVLFPFKEKKVEPIRTTGIVQGKEVNLTSKISGRISELCCREGDAVRRGSIVIRLENDELKAAVEQANASVRRAIADIQTSEANIEVAKARLDETKKQVERITGLYKEALVSQADFDQAVANFDSASATYKATLSELTSAKARLKEAEANLSFQKARLNDTVIAAPISGTIVFKALETGEFVSPGITIFTIVDLENLWVRIDVEETLIGKLGLGSEALISVDAMPEKIIKGKVSEISRYAEFATQRDVKHGRQDIKTFHIKINIEDPERILKPGMTVNVEIPKVKF